MSPMYHYDTWDSLFARYSLILFMGILHEHYNHTLCGNLLLLFLYYQIH